MSVVDREEGAPWPILDLLELGLDDIEDDADGEVGDDLDDADHGNVGDPLNNNRLSSKGNVTYYIPALFLFI